MRKVLHSLCALTLFSYGILNASEHKKSVHKKRMMIDNNAEQQADNKKAKRYDSLSLLETCSLQAVSQQESLDQESMVIDGCNVSFDTPKAKYIFLAYRAQSVIREIEELKKTKEKMQRIIAEYEADNKDNKELTSLYFDDLSRP